MSKKKKKFKEKDTTNHGVIGFVAGIMGLFYYPLFFAVIGIGMAHLNKKYEKRKVWKLVLFLGLVNLFFGISTMIYGISTG